uniref:Putative secreted protein n=1 Tax=Anopheles darlingi TaxID=43151 RepID=A0A2M4DJV5_ANODA
MRFGYSPLPYMLLDRSMPAAAAASALLLALLLQIRCNTLVPNARNHLHCHRHGNGVLDIRCMSESEKLNIKNHSTYVLCSRHPLSSRKRFVFDVAFFRPTIEIRETGKNRYRFTIGRTHIFARLQD